MASPREAVAAAPSLAWNRDDALQDMLVRKVFRRDISRPHALRSDRRGLRSAAVRRARLGHVPGQLAAPHLAEGTFVRISDVHLDVPLFWQCWKLNSPLVQSVTDAVRSAAASLRPQRK